MQYPKKSHPGRAGRKPRPTLKAKGIWCGQITDEQRDFIIQRLSPDERFCALWAAANKALHTDGGVVPPNQPDPSNKSKPVKKVRTPRRR